MKTQSTVVPMKKATKKSTTMKKQVKKMEKKLEDLATQLSSVKRQVEELSTTSVLTTQLSSVQDQVEELVTVTTALQKKLEGSMRLRHPTGSPPPKRPSAALHFPWEQHYSEMYKIWYFWNSETGESVWENPFL